MTIIKHDEEYYKLRKPKPDLGAFKNFKRFVWDPERRAFLDRTAPEWANVGVFYLCFYGVLFSFSALQLWLTYKYVTTHDEPVFKYDRIASRAWLEPNPRAMTSLDLHGPGILVKPNIIPNAKPATIMIDESLEFGQPKKYIESINQMLGEYKGDRSKFEHNCDDRILHEPISRKPCFFDIQNLGKCGQSPYGYSSSSAQPCVYIKYNKRFGWVPIFYTQAAYLPIDMPDWLKKIIRTSDKFHVWLSCEGMSKEDKERISEIEYLPMPGFPVEYFPYSGQSNYHSPMVALRFKNLPVNQVVNVECKAWARNIDNENRHHLNFRILIKQP